MSRHEAVQFSLRSPQNLAICITIEQNALGKVHQTLSPLKCKRKQAVWPRDTMHD